MNTRIFLLGAGALALTACSTSDGNEGTGTMPIAGMTGSGPVVPMMGNTAVPPATMGSPIVGAAGSTPVASGGSSGAAAGGMGAAPAAGGAGGAAPDEMAGSGEMAGSDAMPEEPESEGPLEPIIPEVTGECPDFTSGTKTVGGLGGIVFTVGPKQEGTGSLIFYWHGTGSSALESANIPADARQEIMDKGGIIVAFNGSTGTGGDCSGTATFSLDDFKIADIITACAVKNYNIDPHRIYTTGCSAGGLMAGCMGIQRSSYIAATAPNSGGVTIGYGTIQDPKRIPAVMTMHGGAGDWVIVSFPETSKAYDNYMLRAGSAMVINCDHGGTHCGAPPDLQSSAWQFMKDHPFGTKPSPYAGGLPAGFHPACEIWQMTDTLPIGEGTMSSGSAPAMP